LWKFLLCKFASVTSVVARKLEGGFTCGFIHSQVPWWKAFGYTTTRILDTFDPHNIRLVFPSTIQFYAN
jgi:hypothetical protein